MQFCIAPALILGVGTMEFSRLPSNFWLGFKDFLTRSTWVTYWDNKVTVGGVYTRQQLDLGGVYVLIQTYKSHFIWQISRDILQRTHTRQAWNANPQNKESSHSHTKGSSHFHYKETSIALRINGCGRRHMIQIMTCEHVQPLISGQNIW